MYLYGASGHGKVIKEILEAQHKTVDGFVDDNPGVERQCGLPVLHSLDHVDEVIVSIGANSVRKRIVEKLTCRFAVAVHPSAVCSLSATIGEGTVVMAGAIINAESVIGNHCIVNTGSSIDHECVIGNYVHISPHVTLCGNVRVGEGSWIGAGSTIIPGVRIGRWCVVGAGSVVTKDIPDGYLAAGNGCELIKKIQEDLL